MADPAAAGPDAPSVLTVEDTPSLCVLLIDTCGMLWSAYGLSPSDEAKGGPEEPLPLSLVVEALIMFANTLLLQHEANQLAVFATNDMDCQLLWESKSVASLFDPEARGAQSVQWRLRYPDMRGAIEQGVRASVRQSLERAASHAGASARNSGDRAGPPRLQLAGGLSKALLYAHRVQAACPPRNDTRDAEGARSRIVCAVGSPDVPSQHVALMNATFGARKAGVLIDACMLGHAESAFLQQAAHITGGTYARPKHPGALLPHLLDLLSSNPDVRPILAHVMPPSDTAGHDRAVDLSASCFCHKQRVRKGWVCSVCLSVFCTYRPQCMTCKAIFVDPSKKPGDEGAVAGDKRRDAGGAGGSGQPPAKKPAPGTQAGTA